MKVALIFLIGCGVLVGAVILNMIASQLHLTSWYEFIKQPAGTSMISYIWLFIVYPLGLGALAYYLTKLLIK